MKPDPGILFKRRIKNRFMTGLFVLALLISIGVLMSILWKLTIDGIGAFFTPAIFLKSTPAPGTAGRAFQRDCRQRPARCIRHTLCRAPRRSCRDLSGGIRAQFKIRFTWSGSATTSLLSAPSIIIGLFIYAIVVMPAGHFSGWAGALSLCFIALPVIVRTTEDMLRLGARHAARSGDRVGCPYWRMIVSVGWRAARPGHLDRHSSCPCPHQRRNRAAALYLAEQPVHVIFHECADRFAADSHFSVCHESVSEIGSILHGPARFS